MNAAETAAALRALLDFIEANPELGDRFGRSFTNVMVYAGRENPRQVMADFARAGLAAGAKVVKDFQGDDWAQVFLHFGPIKIEVYSTRAEVCERVVVGTAEVEEEVPDPEALAAVPKVKVTKTVERVEWRCTPILADTRAGGTE